LIILYITSKIITRQLNPPFPQTALPVGEGGGQGRSARTINAQGIKRRGRGLRPCNTEGARWVWQTKNKL